MFLSKILIVILFLFQVSFQVPVLKDLWFWFVILSSTGLGKHSATKLHWLLQIDQSDNFHATFWWVFWKLYYWAILECLFHDLKNLGSQNLKLSKTPPSLSFNISLDHFGFCNPRLFKSWDYLNSIWLIMYRWQNRFSGQQFYYWAILECQIFSSAYDQFWTK